MGAPAGDPHADSRPESESLDSRKLPMYGDFAHVRVLAQDGPLASYLVTTLFMDRAGKVNTYLPCSSASGTKMMTSLRRLDIGSRGFGDPDSSR